MKVMHINSKKDAIKLNRIIKEEQVFILIYMDGCGPCNETKPEWLKLNYTLQQQYGKHPTLNIVHLNKNYIDDVENIGDINGFPTMKYIKNGKIVEEYENSSITNKDRKIDSFVNWIDSHILDVVSITPESSPEMLYKRLSTNTNLKSKHSKSKHSKSKRSKSKHSKSKHK